MFSKIKDFFCCKYSKLNNHIEDVRFKLEKLLDTKVKGLDSDISEINIKLKKLASEVREKNAKSKTKKSK